MGSDELDIQKIASELIEKLQKQSTMYGNQSEKLKWMAEGARELHDVIRREAERLFNSGTTHSVQPASTQGDDDGC